MSDQKGVLIKDANGNVIEKRVYAGDTQGISEQLSIEKVSYEIFDDTDPSFMNAESIPPALKMDTDWQTAKAKGVDVALSFLAKKMGLE